MSADPRFTPVTVGCWAGVVCPCAIVTLDGEIVTLEVSLLTRSIVTPPTGAPVTRLTGNGNGLAGTHRDIRQQRDRTQHGDRDTCRSGVVPRRYRQDRGRAKRRAGGRKRSLGGAGGDWHRGGLEGYKTRTDRKASPTRRRVGAGLLSVIVPVAVRVSPIVSADSVTLTVGDVTLTVANPGRKPVRDRRDRGASDPASRQDRDVDSRQTFRHGDVRRHGGDRSICCYPGRRSGLQDLPRFLMTK